MNKPYELIAQEWEEVAGVRAVQESFGLEDEAGPAEWLRRYTYGVRFEYANEGPGYDGPLYLVKSAGEPEIAPLIFGRVNGALELVDSGLKSGPEMIQACAPPICDGEELVFGEDGSMACGNPNCPNYGREA